MSKPDELGECMDVIQGALAKKSFHPMTVQAACEIIARQSKYDADFEKDAIIRQMQGMANQIADSASKPFDGDEWKEGGKAE